MNDALASGDGPAPDISLIIPAYNEAAYLPRLLDSVEVSIFRFHSGAQRIEVIVADNDSTDDTSRIAAQRGCRVAHVSRRLIAAARNGGAAAARGRLVAFADADFRIHPETFNYIDAAMADGRYVGGATGLVMERWSVGIRVTWYVVLPPLWSLGMDGGVWSCRRADFQEVGGFDDSRAFAEDAAFLGRLKRLGAGRRPKQKLGTRFAGKKLGRTPALAINSARKFDKHGDWHMIRDALRAPFYLLFRRSKIDDYAREYWYEDRAESQQ